MNDREKEEQLQKLLEKEYLYYCNVLIFTQEENDTFRAHGSINDVTTVMKKKKIILACIDDIEPTLAPLKNYWNVQSDHLGSYSGEIKKLLALLGNTLKEILSLDEANRAMFNEYLLKISRDSKKLSV